MILASTSSVFAADVLLLHSCASPSPWTDQLSAGVKESLGTGAEVTQSLLGTPLFDDDYFDEKAEQLLENWNDLQPQVIVADGDLAFAFMRKYQEVLFPNVPVVYCGMTRPAPELLAQCVGCTGVDLVPTVQETIDLIFRLQPSTSMVVAITDGQPDKRMLRQSTEAAMERYVATARVLFPGHEPGDDSGLDKETLRVVASSVPVGASVLLLNFDVDAYGNSLTMRDVATIFGNHTDAPVFTLDPVWVQGGILGSVGAMPKDHGRQVGVTVKRLLGGESVEDVTIQSSKPSPVVDLTALARFGLDSGRIPENAVRLNPLERPVNDAEVISAGGVLLVVGGGVFVAVVVGIGLIARWRAG